MELVLIIGPMFSGKSEEVKRLLSRAAAVGKECVYIDHTINTRDPVQDIEIKRSCRGAERAIIKHIRIPRLHEAFVSSGVDVIAIDEAQFFSDLSECVIGMINNSNNVGKTVIISGLNGDSSRKPFGQIVDLIPYATDIVFLKACCTGNDVAEVEGSILKDEYKAVPCRSPACYTKRRKSSRKEQILIGDDDYLPVCHRHY